jgi:hypothetical protein
VTAAVSHPDVSVDHQPARLASLSSAAVSRHYVKVNQAPYLLELDLAGGVDDAAAVVTVNRVERTITLTLPKETPGRWGVPNAEGSREDLRARREASVAALRERQAQASHQVEDFLESAQTMLLIAHSSFPDRASSPLQAAAERAAAHAALERALQQEQLATQDRQREALRAAQDAERRAAEVRPTGGTFSRQLSVAHVRHGYVGAHFTTRSRSAGPLTW